MQLRDVAKINTKTKQNWQRRVTLFRKFEFVACSGCTIVCDRCPFKKARHLSTRGARWKSYGSKDGAAHRGAAILLKVYHCLIWATEYYLRDPRICFATTGAWLANSACSQTSCVKNACVDFIPSFAANPRHPRQRRRREPVLRQAAAAVDKDLVPRTCCERQGACRGPWCDKVVVLYRR